MLWRIQYVCGYEILGPRFGATAEAAFFANEGTQRGTGENVAPVLACARYKREIGYATPRGERLLIFFRHAIQGDKNGFDRSCLLKSPPCRRSAHANRRTV